MEDLTVGSTVAITPDPRWTLGQFTKGAEKPTLHFVGWAVVVTNRQAEVIALQPTTWKHTTAVEPIFWVPGTGQVTLTALTAQGYTFVQFTRETASARNR